MPKEIRVPALGESVSEATIGKWFRAEGDQVKADEPLVELETDKVTVEVPAPASGKLAQIAAKPGSTVNVGALLGAIEEGAVGAKPSAAPQPAAKAGAPPQKPEPQPATPATPPSDAAPLSPAVRKIVAESRIDTASMTGTGKDGRLTKGDVLEQLAKPISEAKPAISPVAPIPPQPQEGREERVRMSRLRLTIARRLKDAQNTAAMLTTFNEVDMSAVMGMRAEYREIFEKKHGVKLGFMSF